LKREQNRALKVVRHDVYSRKTTTTTTTTTITRDSDRCHQQRAMSLLLFATRARAVVCLPPPSLNEGDFVFFLWGHDPSFLLQKKSCAITKQQVGGY